MSLMTIEASTTVVGSEIPESILHHTKASHPSLGTCLLASSHSHLALGHTSLAKVGEAGAGFGETTVGAGKESVQVGVSLRGNKARKDLEMRTTMLASWRMLKNQLASQETNRTSFKDLWRNWRSSKPRI